VRNFKAKRVNGFEVLVFPSARGPRVGRKTGVVGHPVYGVSHLVADAGELQDTIEWIVSTAEGYRDKENRQK